MQLFVMLLKKIIFNVIYIFSWLHAPPNMFIYYLITMMRKYCRVKENNTKLMNYVKINYLINIRYIGYYFKNKKLGTTKPL